MASIESRNGFAVYHHIAQMIEAVPENADFVMTAKLLQLASVHWPKVRDLKSLYAFRLLVNKHNAEFRKTIGSSSKDEQSKLIVWNVLDPDSKRHAATDDTAKRDYNAIAKWIDDRYRIVHRTLDYKLQTKDDPMGLALIADGARLEV